MKHIVFTAILAPGVSNSASAVCKYKAADGSWIYAKTCREKPEKEIDESVSLVLQKNYEQQKPDESVEGRRLQGYEYSDTIHSGMRIRMVEPNKGTPEKEFTNHQRSEVGVVRGRPVGFARHPRSHPQHAVEIRTAC